jgi:putative flippase GtrA
MIRQFVTPQFYRFLLTGGIAACVNLGSRFLYEHALPYVVAVILAYLTGMVTAYILARVFVFTGSQRGHVESSFRFLVVNIAGILQTTIVSVFLGDYLLPAVGFVTYAHDVGHLAGVTAPVFVSFVLHRRWTFG